VYNELKKEIRLSGVHEIEHGVRWRDDILQVIGKRSEWEDNSKDGQARRMETVHRLVEGRGTPQTDSPSSTSTFLDGIIRPNTLTPDSSDFSSLIKLVHVVLSFRDYEAKIFGQLLDPNARSVLISSRNFLLQKTASQTSTLSSSSNEPTFQIDLGGSRGTVWATPEQDALIKSPLGPGITLSMAHAGTGKSTAIVGLAQRIGKQDGVAGFALTRGVMKDHNKRFQSLDVPGLASFKTIDSLTHYLLRTRYGSKFWTKFKDDLEDKLRQLGWREVGKLLGIGSKGYMPTQYSLSGSTSKTERLLKKRYRELSFTSPCDG